MPARDSAEYKRAWRVAPDIVVEVVSPSQFRPEMAVKAQRCLAAGMRLIWVVWPRYQQVDVWRPGAAQPTQTLARGEQLDGLGVLSGFTYPLARMIGPPNILQVKVHKSLQAFSIQVTSPSQNGALGPSLT